MSPNEIVKLILFLYIYIFIYYLLASLIYICVLYKGKNYKITINYIINKINKLLINYKKKIKKKKKNKENFIFL